MKAEKREDENHSFFLDVNFRFAFVFVQMKYECGRHVQQEKSKLFESNLTETVLFFFSDSMFCSSKR